MRLNLKCINSSQMIDQFGELHLGLFLYEGENYSAIGMQKNKYGQWCYMIEWVGLRLCSRFEKCQDVESYLDSFEYKKMIDISKFKN